ncbi:PDZ and LIM domain protein 7 isoform X9 [Eurosta solidaginis]|uniref:PDZ and LIM domain protein 7 isoform X9 n=1 Tax=Eurosta solidaginis TaxID=178769 RepID=UPI003530D9BE
MSQPQLIQIKLSRFDAQPWGFRLQGGVDFAQPLVVQKVNGGSLAEKAGLIPGDALIRINDVDVYNLRHKDAQDIVVRSGNNFVLTIQRGGSTWRPHITPTGNVPQPQHISPYLQTVTKTSLAHKQQDSQHIGCGYNNAARPYANGGDASVKSIVNKQYNTPVGIYSDESIAETLSAQAEVLAGGVLGVNFKKNEKEYQPDKSEVLKFLREEETGQSSPGITDNKTNAQAAAIAIKAKAINTTSQVNSVTSSASAAGATNASAAAAAPTSFPPPQKLDNEKPNTDLDGSTGVGGKGAFGATSAPKRGRGIINKAVAPGVRVPLCSSCNIQIRGPFITALGRIWCPEHFICVNANCRRPLQDIGFVEEKGDLYCEFCFEKYLAPSCSKCGGKIKGDCLNAIGKQFHPECFTCGHCGKLFGNTPFFLEDGKAYCEADWNELFTTKCFACGFPVEAGDRWVEALSHNYHSQCFNCTYCKQNLEGQSFYNKGGRPFCKNHAR